LEHVPAQLDVVRSLQHLADDAVTGFGSGLAKQFVAIAVDILERRGFAVYGTKTAIERLEDLGERLIRRMDEAEDRLSALSSDVVATRQDDPSFRVTMAEAIEAGAESSAGDAREVLADLTVRRLLTGDAAEAGRQRRAIAVIRSLDGRTLRLIGAVGTLLHPAKLAEWPPFAQAIASKDPGALEMAMRELLARLLPEDPTAADLATLVELGLVEREPTYQPYGMANYADSIQSFLQHYGFPSIPPVQSALDNFWAVARAGHLLMPRQPSGVTIEDDGRGLAGYRLLPVGYLISESVVDRLLLRDAA